MPQKKSGFGGSSTGLGCHSFLSINIFILRGMDDQLDIEKIRMRCMARIYHKCHFCGGEVLEKRITTDYRWGEDLIAIIENVSTINQKAKIIRRLPRFHGFRNFGHECHEWDTN